MVAALLGFQRQVYHLPRQAAQVELFHERIGVVLLHVPHAGLFPQTTQDHLCTDHRRYASGVADRLAGDFLVALLVVAGVLNEKTLLLTVFGADDVAADAGLTFGARPETARVG